MNTRIEMSDNVVEVVIKLAEGNPGAVNVLAQLLKRAATIDPQDIMGSLGSILFLDTLNIYAERIWMLYKDVCRQDIVLVVAMLRAVQLGFIRAGSLNYAIDHHGEGLKVDEILAKVKNRLDQFDVQQVTQS